LKERLKIARLKFAARSVEHNCGQGKPFQQTSRHPVFSTKFLLSLSPAGKTANEIAQPLQNSRTGSHS